MSYDVNKYIAARAEYVEVWNRVQDLGKFISALGNSLTRAPGDFHFDQLPGAAGISFQTLRDPEGAFDASRWPHPAQIADLVADLRQKKQGMETHWSSIPANARDGLVAPPR